MSDHGHLPALRIVRGDPSPEEVAALVAVLAAASSAGAEATGPAPDAGQWAPPDRLVRAPLAPTGWWASSLPR